MILHHLMEWNRQAGTGVTIFGCAMHRLSTYLTSCDAIEADNCTMGGLHNIYRSVPDICSVTSHMHPTKYYELLSLVIFSTLPTIIVFLDKLEVLSCTLGDIVV